MSTQIIQKNITFQGTEANVLFYEPIFRDMLGLEVFTIMPNVKNKAKMGFVTNLEKIVKKKTGCGFNPKGSMSVYERSISVSPCAVETAICVDQFKNTVWKQKLKTGNSQYDVQGTQIMDVYLTSLTEGVKNDIIRLFWFGDEASTDTDYNMTDGVWMVHIPKLVAENLIPYTNTNSGSPLASGDAIDYLQAVYDAQPLALKGLPTSMKKFMVSGSIYDQYIKDLQAIDVPANGASIMVNGVQTVAFNNIPLIPFYEWDKWDELDLGSPKTHRILLTTPENLVIASDVYSDTNSFLSWYDMRTEETYTKANFDLGTNYVHESLFSVGY